MRSYQTASHAQVLLVAIQLVLTPPSLPGIFCSESGYEHWGKNTWHNFWDSITYFVFLTRHVLLADDHLPTTILIISLWNVRPGLYPFMHMYSSSFPFYFVKFELSSFNDLGPQNHKVTNLKYIHIPFHMSNKDYLPSCTSFNVGSFMKIP